MIVRILGEGQFKVGDEAAASRSLSRTVSFAAVEAGDDTAFKAALGASARLVREAGTRVPDEEFVTADFILPFADANVAEVRKLLADGTIPGDSIGHP